MGMRRCQVVCVYVCEDVLAIKTGRQNNNDTSKLEKNGMTKIDLQLIGNLGYLDQMSW